jgi:MSHA biogenesis protein MshJ
MGDLKIRLKALADRVDALSVRERGMVFFGVVVVLYLIAYNVVFGPLRAEQVRLEKDLQTKREQVLAADRQIGALFSHDGKDINAGNRAKLATLSEQIKAFDAQVDQMTSGVVPPKEMAKLIEQMLTRTKHLELIKLEALPPKPLDGDANANADGKSNAASSAVATGVTVYRHGMRVEFKGRYFDIVSYLKSLEGLPWKVYWGEVSLETDKYPISKVSLVIYTLSRYPGWIGV